MGLFNTKFLSAASLSAALFVTSFMPVQAMVPVPMQKPVQTTNAAEPVQYRDRGDREEWRRRGMHRRGNQAYYNGHRGYRERRRGYREHNGMWFPLAAFATGAIIGGAVNNSRPARVSGSHVSWCQNRYRSYRSYDNTFQPNNGPRQQCNSPY